MTEDSKVIEFGSHTGQVIRFFNKKGFGFIRDLQDDTDYFVYYGDIMTKDGIYKKLYPGEYVSYNLGTQEDGRDKCIEIRGIMGNALLTENPDHNYRVFQKQDSRPYDNNTHDGPVCESDDSDSQSDSDPIEEKEEEKEEEKINKEAPEGIEVAEFDGLNINEDMS